MKTKISALIDGELDSQEIREVSNSLRIDSELRRQYGTYILIGDALRYEPHLALEITSSVLDDLAGDPIVFAPANLRSNDLKSQKWVSPLLAMAATFAGVAVVAWLGFHNDAWLRAQDRLQLASSALVQRPYDGASNIAVDADMQGYLIAHQTQGGAMFLNGDTQHIRTVSLARVESLR